MNQTKEYFGSTDVKQHGGRGYYVFHQYQPINCKSHISVCDAHTHTHKVMMIIKCILNVCICFVSQFKLPKFDTKMALGEQQQQQQEKVEDFFFFCPSLFCLTQPELHTQQKEGNSPTVFICKVN